MTSVTSLGSGSGIDLESIVTKLMTAERAPITALNTKISSTQTQISLYGTIKTKLAALQTAAETLEFPSKLSAVKASSSDSDTVSATANFNAPAGTYAVEVTQLAKGQKSFTQEYEAGTSFSPGTLNFSVGNPPVAATPIELNDSGKTSYTLEEVRDKINAAGIGVTATVVNTSSGGQRMVLSSTTTGAASAFSLSSNVTASNTTSGASQAGLNDAGFDSSAALAQSTAQDGKIKIDGVEVKSSTNTYANAINGITFTASQLSTAGSTAIKVETDSAKIVSAVKAFVSAYNDVVTTVKSNSSYDSTTKTAQPLSGDFVARSVTDTLNSLRMTVPSDLASATITSLSQLGVSIQQTGLLSVDETTLNNSVSSSASNAMTALQSYGKAFSDGVSAMTSTGGAVANRVSSLNSSLRIYNDNLASLEDRMTAIEKRYRTQFSAMDTLVAQFKATSSSLSQMFKSG